MVFESLYESMSGTVLGWYEKKNVWEKGPYFYLNSFSIFPTFYILCFQSIDSSKTMDSFAYFICCSDIKRLVCSISFLWQLQNWPKVLSVAIKVLPTRAQGLLLISVTSHFHLLSFPEPPLDFLIGHLLMFWKQVLFLSEPTKKGASFVHFSPKWATWKYRNYLKFFSTDPHIYNKEK